MITESNHDNSNVQIAVGSASYGFLTENQVGGFWGAFPTLLLAALTLFPLSP